jgi:hypothetical protein
MLYKLPEVYKDATHLLVEEAQTDYTTMVRAIGRLGTLEKEAFIPDPDLISVTRTITGTEYTKGFHPYVEGQGAPNGNFRDVDLVVWFDKYGWRGTTWAE